MVKITNSEIERVTGVHPSTKCARCGKTAREKAQEPPIDTGANQGRYRWSKSFHGWQHQPEKWCSGCHKEMQLEKLFQVMPRK